MRKHYKQKKKTRVPSKRDDAREIIAQLGVPVTCDPGEQRLVNVVRVLEVALDLPGGREQSMQGGSGGG